MDINIRYFLGIRELLKIKTVEFYIHVITPPPQKKIKKFSVFKNMKKKLNFLKTQLWGRIFLNISIIREK